MARGQYTAYQLFQNAHFPQVNKASVEPYTGQAYQCPHSQLAFMPQFNDFAERNYFDAAYQGCCGEPVDIFTQNPQFQDQFDPPTPKNCGEKQADPPCYQARLQNLGTLKRCAPDGANLSTGKISIECHQACQEFAGIPKNGGTWQGKYGTLTIIGIKGNQALLEYKLKESLSQEVYDYCLDNLTYTEIFCNQAVTFDVWGGLTSPENCYCDCCGKNGGMSVPTLVMTIENDPTGQDIWTNEWNMGDFLITGVCKDHSIFGGFFSPYSDKYLNVSYTEGPTYNGDLRAETGTFADLGDSGSPICCGGVFGLSIHDNTCPDPSWPPPLPQIPTTFSVLTNYNFPSMITTPAVIDVTPAGMPLLGDIALSDGNVYTFTASPVCSYSGSAGLSVYDSIWEWAGVQHDCAEGEYGTVTASDGTLSQVVTVHVKDTPSCKACCGRAKMIANGADGCGTDIGNKTFYVVTDYSPANPFIGWKVWCEVVGSDWREMKDRLRCDGTLEGSFSYLSATLHTSESNCAQGLDLNAPGLCTSGGMGDCTTCCNYARAVGGASVGRVVCAANALCCDWAAQGPFQSGSWSYGSAQTCCN